MKYLEGIVVTSQSAPQRMLAEFRVCRGLPFSYVFGNICGAGVARRVTSVRSLDRSQ